MNKKTLQLLIQKIFLQIKILQIQLAIKLLGQKRTVPNLKNPTKIILHHGGGWANFKQVNEYHRRKWGFKSSLGFYMGYTIFIDRDGTVTQARADIEEGAHTKGFNKRTIGIGVSGNGVVRDFAPAQYKSLKKLVDEKLAQYKLPKSKLYGHNAFSPTLCPSKRLEKWILKY